MPALSLDSPRPAGIEWAGGRTMVVAAFTESERRVCRCCVRRWPRTWPQAFKFQAAKKTFFVHPAAPRGAIKPLSPHRKGASPSLPNQGVGSDLSSICSIFVMGSLFSICGISSRGLFQGKHLQGKVSC